MCLSSKSVRNILKFEVSKITEITEITAVDHRVNDHGGIGGPAASASELTAKDNQHTKQNMIRMNLPEMLSESDG